METLNLNKNWKFAYGHASDQKRDFGYGMGQFSCFAKAGYGDGAASLSFDDRPWRTVHLPHDWCVELPFDRKGRNSHGSKAIGPDFPENSIGWYRKHFSVSESDEGPFFELCFDGVFRQSIVWVNGFYLGCEASGYSGFSYNISEYLNYGGDNVIAVRVEATGTEGWFYEGAGIYRNVFLRKTDLLHLKRDSLFIRSFQREGKAEFIIEAAVINRSDDTRNVSLKNRILSPDSSPLAESAKNRELSPGVEDLSVSELILQEYIPWSPERPFLYTVETTLWDGEKCIDKLITRTGIREIVIDPDKGLIINGNQIKIKGVNLHQDHAGVGIAVPDGLWEYRLKQVLAMGSNAVRTAHHPPSPGMLKACDKLGILVLNETRLMGVNSWHLSCLERMIRRDRNHPCIFLWSLGNEEWAIEGNGKGSKIALAMQKFARKIDSSRPYTIAMSGGWDEGIGSVIDVMGYNYIFHGDIDGHHMRFPHQAGLGTEETTTHQTRGIYRDQPERDFLAPVERHPELGGTEFGWQFYAERSFLGGLFYWTGFDYRGESNPDGPAVISQSGLMDLCGFPKDGFYYCRSWWQNEPVLFVGTDWASDSVSLADHPVWVYSNCHSVELLVDGKSYGENKMPALGHLEWSIPASGVQLDAIGRDASGKEIVREKIRKAGDAAQLSLSSQSIKSGSGEETIHVVEVSVNDKWGRLVPLSENEIELSLTGEGRILGIGNGNPSSLEEECFFPEHKIITIENLKEKAVDSLDERDEVASDYDDSDWIPAFSGQSRDWKEWQKYSDPLMVIRGRFELPPINENSQVTLFSKSITEGQSLFVNGRKIATEIKRDDPNQAFKIPFDFLKKGVNSYALTGTRFRKSHMFDEPNEKPGVIGIISPQENWKRKVFNGLAQVIVETQEFGKSVSLKVSSDGIASAEICLN